MSALHKMATRCGEPELPRRIYDACLNKQAFLFVRGNDGFVLRPTVVDGVVEVLVWAGWGSHGASVRHIDEVKRRARLIGARRIRFHTVRKGFLRVAPRIGFECSGTDELGRMVFILTL